MNFDLKFSIVTVVYNSSADLLTTIGSIKSQCYGNYEYIVVDGGSTDGTLDVIKENIKHIDKYVSEQDNGIYDAMNKGVALAEGDYIIFMNAGDSFFDVDILSKVSELMEAPDIFYGSCNVIGSRKSDGIRACQDIKYIPYGMVCSHQSMFFKTEVLLKQCFSTEFSTAGDYELILRLWVEGAVFQYDERVIVSNYLAKGVSDINRFWSVTSRIKALHARKALKSRIMIFYFKELLRALLVDGFRRLTS